jgi:superfamily II DNA or RNA helicase
MHREEQGLIIRPPGTGKTEIATAFMAEAETRSLVLVHTEDILRQWVERVERNIPELQGEVGIIRGKTCKIGQITIATVQTLYRSYMDKPAKVVAAIRLRNCRRGAPRERADLGSRPEYAPCVLQIRFHR